MTSVKYIGMDVHKEAISIALMNGAGKLLMESIIETKARTYLAISKDLVRVMNRLKALYRGWGIACSGRSVYAPNQRAVWLKKITEPGVRLRAEYFYQQLDTLQRLRREARRHLLSESRKHSATKILSQIPTIGPIRAALLVALIQTPHRFRTKRQLWAYSGLAVEKIGRAHV